MPTNSTAKAIEIGLSAPTIQQPERGGHGKSDEDADQHGHDDARANRAPATGCRSGRRARPTVLSSAVLLERAEFLILDRDWPGQSDLRAISDQLEIGGGLADGRVAAWPGSSAL